MTTMEKVSVAYNLKVAESSLDLSTEAINTANQYVLSAIVYI